MDAGSMIPLRMVWVTCPPARAAPANSKMAAIMIAVVTVIGAGADRRAHDVGDVVGANTPCHIQAEDDRNDDKQRAVQLNNFHDS